MENFTAEDLALLNGAGAKSIFAGGICVMIFGFLGNSLIIILKTHQSTRTSADAAYKVALAIADTVSLCVGMTRHLFYISKRRDPIDLSITTCRALFFSMYACQYISTWILVALNVERCYTIIRPLALRRTWRTPVAVGLIIIALFLVSQIWFFLVFEMSSDKDGNQRCGVKDKHKELFRYLFPLFTIIFNAILPSIIFFSAHGVIVRLMHEREHTIAQSVWRVAPQQATSSPGTVTDVTVQDRTEGPDDGAILPRTRRPAVMPVVKGHERATLRFLLVMDISFMILVLPREIFIVASYLAGSNLVDLRSVKWRLQFAAFSVFAYLNNTLNCVYYLILSKRFRADAMRLFFRRVTRPVPAFTGITSRVDVKRSQLDEGTLTFYLRDKRRKENKVREDLPTLSDESEEDKEQTVNKQTEKIEKIEEKEESVPEKAEAIQMENLSEENKTKNILENDE